MTEQATGTTQITAAAESMRIQTEQAAKATAEQARAITDLSDVSNNIAKQIKLISRANREHSVAAGGFLTSLGEIKGITERNASGAKETVNRTNGLLSNARRLTEMAEMLSVAGKSKSGNGRRAPNGVHPVKPQRGPTRGRKRKS